MNSYGMNLERLVTRWEDRREIQNLMGRYTYDLMLKREKDIFETYWCKQAPAPCLGFNDGYYQGYDAIRGYYAALHEKNLLRTRLIASDFPEKLADRTPEEMYGGGILEHKPLCNQIVEIARDGKTAKGFWYAVGKEDEYGLYGPLSYWTFGMFGVDFVWEEDQWRIWHLTYVEDVNHPCGESWTQPAKERDVNEHYRPLAQFAMPPYTTPMEVRKYYAPDRPHTKTLPLPSAYGSFAETFSYGI